MQSSRLANRRNFLRWTAAGTASVFLATACSPAAAPAPTTAPAPAAPTTAPAAAAKPTTAAAAATAPAAAAQPTTAAAAGATPTPTGPLKFNAPPATAPAGYKPATGKLEIFSWWTSGGEVEALDYLYADYKALNPQSEIVNSAMTGGTASGGNMKAVLQTRMMGGESPESFQIHLGHELIDNHVVAGRMEPLDELYTSEGWDKVFPKGLIDIASYQGKPWSVPVNIHRANVLWYNKKMFADVGATDAPKTWDEYFAIGDKLKAKGLPLIGVAESSPGFWAHVTETMMISTLGADGYRGLFNGTTKWDDKRVTDALNISVKALEYANKDFLSVSWGDINDLVVTGKCASIIQGDWTPGVLWSKGFSDFGWAPAPGNAGIYDMLSDSFGLPKGVKNRDAAINWLKVCGSKHGQEGFNFYKGSIPARTDADFSQFTPYHRDAAKDWTSNQLVPSIVHGAAAKDSFNVDYQTAINVLATKKDVASAQGALVKSAKDADFKA
jgi:glucose/mannose transport system substrate-binding protein